MNDGAGGGEGGNQGGGELFGSSIASDIQERLPEQIQPKVATNNEPGKDDHKSVPETDNQTESKVLGKGQLGKRAYTSKSDEKPVEAPAQKKNELKVDLK